LQLKVTVRVRNDAPSGIESVGRGRLQTDSVEGNVEFDAPTIQIGSASKAGAGARSQGDAVFSGFISRERMTSSSRRLDEMQADPRLDVMQSLKF
jgi:hypothetical protein